MNTKTDTETMTTVARNMQAFVEAEKASPGAPAPLSLAVRRMLRSYGFPSTAEGFAAYRQMRSGK